MSYPDIDKIILKYENSPGISHELLRLVKELPTLMDLATIKWGEREPNITFDLIFVAHNEIFTDFGCTIKQIRLGPLYSLESNYGYAKHLVTQELVQLIAPPIDVVNGWTNLDKGISTTFSERYSGFSFPLKSSNPSYHYACELFKKFEGFAGEGAIKEIRERRKSQGQSTRFSEITENDIIDNYGNVPIGIARDLVSKWDRNDHVKSFPNLTSWYVA